MFTLFIFLVVLSVLIVVHEFGHFIMAKRCGVRVDEFCLGFGRKILKKKVKDTEYGIASIPLGGYVKMAGDNREEYTGKPDEFLSKSAWQRFKIIFFGPLLNYLLGIICFWFIFCIGYPQFTTKVGGLLDGFGAKNAGVQIGDKVLAINGKPVQFFEDLQKEIHSKKETTIVELTVERGSQRLKILVDIQEKKVDDPLGEKKSIGLLGITPADEIVTVRHNIFQSFILGIQKTGELTVITYKGLWRMLTGKISVRESVSGPIGIFMLTSKMASLGIIPLIHFLALLSVSLAIFNLLPLPILDGGHIVLLGLEKIRKKPLSAKAENMLTQVGMSLIITLAVVVSYNDIVKIFGDKIAKFFTR